MKSQSSFKAGMYLLETLTSGMYNDPLSIYREYIQNAVDSIDASLDKRGKQVNVTLFPEDKRIVIYDNGPGIKARKAEEVLSGIGSSNKAGRGYRGFRGIGRLGGIAFSNRVIFRTKAKGEDVESTQIWDCAKLREFISNPSNSLLSIHDLFESSTTFEKSKSQDINKSFFEVTLDRVASFRNYIFDLKKVREYISQVAPVNYNDNIFSHTSKINKYMKSMVKDFNSYPITLNNKNVQKPYKDILKVSKGSFDAIIDIEFLALSIKDKPAAFGWYGHRKELLGSISKGDESSGIRVRVGNILIGDSHLLDRCFRESRFNSYMIGEIHIVSPDLIPNSRRDDFIDNEAKTIFYNEIEKAIGLPVSREIRLRSKSQNALNINTGSLEAPQKLTTQDENNKLKGLSVVGCNNRMPSEEVIRGIIKNCSNCNTFIKIVNDSSSCT